MRTYFLIDTLFLILDVSLFSFLLFFTSRKKNVNSHILRLKQLERNIPIRKIS